MADLCWKFGWILPNVSVEKPYGTEIMKIVPPEDEIVQTLANEHKNVAEIVGRFTNEFGIKFRPSILVYRSDAPKITGREIAVIVGIRDAIAISSVLKGWSRLLGFESQGDILYSNNFDFYPWTLSQDFSDIRAITPGFRGLHLVEKFGGQISPALPTHELRSNNVDEVLLAAILERWSARFGTGKPAKSDVSLFRSLRIAFAASQAPAGVNYTHFDVGRHIGLWISACESLVHPIKDSADANVVCEILRASNWTNPKLRRRRYVRPASSGTSKRNKNWRKITLSEWLYRWLHFVRNDYFHGNPVTDKSVLIRCSGNPLISYAPLLFRSLLAHQLSLYWPAEFPLDVDAPEPWHEYNDKYRMMKMEQGFSEDALLGSTARKAGSN